MSSHSDLWEECTRIYPASGRLANPGIGIAPYRRSRPSVASKNLNPPGKFAHLAIIESKKKASIMRRELEYPTEWAMPSSTEEDNGRPEPQLGISTVDVDGRDVPAEKVVGFAPAAG